MNKFYSTFSKSKENHSAINENISNNKKENKISKVFEVFHKNETIFINKNSELNSKINQIIKYKCFYCGNSYKNRNRLEIHMIIHVSK